MPQASRPAARPSPSTATAEATINCNHQLQSSVYAATGYPTSTYQQIVTGDYSDQEADYSKANSDGSATGTVQALSTTSQDTNTFSSLVGTRKVGSGTITYDNASANTDIGSTSITTNLGVWPSGAQYGTVMGVTTDNSAGSFQINVEANLNKGTLYSNESAGASNTMSMTDTEVASFANSFVPTTTDTLVTSTSGSGYDSLLAFAKLSDGNGHTGDWLYQQTTTGDLDSLMRITWVQVGNGNWTMTSNWFSQSSSGNSNYSYFQEDNGLNAMLMPGETGSFSNTQLTLGSVSQSKTQTGSFDNFSFTLNLTRSEIQTTKSTWSTSIAALGAGNDGSSSSFKVSGTQVDETGQQVNGFQNFSDLKVYQFTVSNGGSDGSSYAPNFQSTTHVRSRSTYRLQLSGSSAKGTGQKTTSEWQAMWGATTNYGRTTPWGNSTGNTFTTTIDLSWPKVQAPPPPAPPPPPGKTGNWLLDLPPQPISGPGLIEQVEGKLRRNAQYEAMGQTPSPLTGGALPAYGNGNQTAGQAFADGLTLATQMLSTSAGPLSLGFNLAMTVGSAVNGNGQDALSYAAQSYINALEFASILNPCSAAAKALSLYSFTQNGAALFDNGFTLKGALLTLYDLGGLFGACFTGDMLLLCEGGKKRADAIREGDLLWSQDEHDPDGPLVLKRVLRRFERTAKIWHMRVADRLLRTTVEHPFWVENRQAWLPVGELQIGDVVRTDAGELLPVEAIEGAGKWEKVYNWEIEDYHTYFVSASEEGANIWAHNAECTVQENRTNGNAFRDSIAAFLRDRGFIVGTEQYISTPYGKRYIDIVVRDGAGKILNGFETKLGKSRYYALQRLKDNWIAAELGWIVNLVRG